MENPVYCTMVNLPEDRAWDPTRILVALLRYCRTTALEIGHDGAAHPRRQAAVALYFPAAAPAAATDQSAPPVGNVTGPDLHILGIPAA